MGNIAPSFRPGRTKETFWVCLSVWQQGEGNSAGLAKFLPRALVLTTFLGPAACSSSAIPVLWSRFPVPVNWVYSAAPSGASPIYILEILLFLPRETQWEYFFQSCFKKWSCSAGYKKEHGGCSQKNSQPGKIQDHLCSCVILPYLEFL